MGPEIVVRHIGGSTLAGREQRVAKLRAVVGRRHDCDIAFDTHRDLSVSGTHAELYVDDDKLYVKDLGSRNGTYVNGNRVMEPIQILPNDVLNFGYDGPEARASFEACKIEGEVNESISGGGHGVEITAPPQAKAFSYSTLIAVVLFAFAAGLIAVAGWRQLSTPKSDGANSEQPAPLRSTPTVSAFGRIEPDGGLINVSASPGEIVEEILVSEGDAVSRNQDLIRLRSHALAQAELEAAKAALSDAVRNEQAARRYGEALVSEARYGLAQTAEPLDLEIQAAEAQIEVLEKNLELAADDTKKLEDKGDQVPAEQLSRQRTVEKGVQLELESAKSNLQTLRSTVRIKRDLARSQFETAQANKDRLEAAVSVESATKNVQRAMARLDLATLRAPRSGQILKILVRRGAAAGSIPVLQMGDIERMYVAAEVYETDLRRVKPGQSATISSAALPAELHGKIERVLYTVSHEGMRSLDPTAPADLRVVPVKIRIDDTDVAEHRELLARLVNLQVDVFIEVGADDREED